MLNYKEINKILEQYYAIANIKKKSAVFLHYYIKNFHDLQRILRESIEIFYKPECDCSVFDNFIPLEQTYVDFQSSEKYSDMSRMERFKQLP